ncbi:MAG: CapA family protein [Leptolyngbyaceae cyanobacterium SL_7_1]|nr:CapA family protein [Leptolyngbyaceae cyanobacterium SL_7_1]
MDMVTIAPAPAQPLRPVLDSLESAEIAVIGAGHNRRDARKPEIIEVRGQRIAYLGYHDSDTATARWWRSGSNQAIDAQITEDIQAIRQHVDWVVVNYRWSGNLAEYPADWQVRLAHHAIDQGADLVVGHHPTVLQGAEVYKGRAIAYSLGDFIYANSQAAQQNYNTAVLKVALRGKQMRLELLPVQVRQSRPAIVEGEDGKAILRYLQQASGLFEQPLQTPMVLDGRSSTPVPLAPASPSEAWSESPDSFTDYSDQAPLAPIDAPEELPPAVEPESQTDSTVEEWSEEEAWVEEALPEAPADFSVEGEFVEEW